MLGTWDKDNIFHPISLPNLQSLHLDCFKDNEWADRRRVQPLTIWHSLVPALQQVATLPDTPSSARITALGVSRSGPDDKSIHRTFLRCNIKKEARDTKTWAFPVTDLLGLNSSPADYIRMRDGESYVILDSRDIITIAGGQPWRTLATGTRLPTAWTRGKVLMPDHGIFEYTEWNIAHRRNHPMLIQNERISGQSLIDAEEREGYLNTESLIEKTPKGFVRYGGPVWRNWRLYAEDDDGPDGLTPDAPNATVGRD
ncbi:hypothetical protein FLAG1_10075 [Fusarium langsethiae]|uniref:Uncharacterized protein n=1 Tax=Fusarium langsethiae TaxID=179993 RepID=A0A0M9EPS9_FUSLA|nr:hypothetical protein FLAG1_10075 [Fusarium langsethiae]